MRFVHLFPVKTHLLFLMVCALTTDVWAGRPLTTDDAGVVERGVFEIEPSYTYVDSSDDEHNLNVVMTTGIMDGFDVGIEAPYQFIDTGSGDDPDGFSDVSLTTKWNFYSRSEGLDATLSFNFKSDSGNVHKSLGTGTQEYTVLGILSFPADDLTMHLNVGPTFVNDGADGINYLAAVEWPFSDNLSFVGEVYGSHVYEGTFNDNPLSALFGWAWTINDTVVLDTGIAVGISDAEPDMSVTTGLTIVFE